MHQAQHYIEFFMHESHSQHSTYTESEIDLFEFSQNLWEHKKLIFCISSLAMLIGLTFALLLPPVYQSSTQIRPPSLSELSHINETGILRVSPTEAFAKALNEIRSQHAKMRTFQQLEINHSTNTSHKEPIISDWDWRKLSDNIQISGTSDSNFVTISYSHRSSNFSAEVVNTLISTSNQLAVEALIEELKSSLHSRIIYLEAQIEQEIELEARSNLDRITQLKEKDELARLQIIDRISSLRAKNDQLRLDRIVILEEALSLAKSLDIVDSRILTQVGDNSSGRLSIRADVDGNSDSLYLRGTKMLAAEISALKARTSSDFTSTEIRDLQERLARLEYNREIELLKARKDNAAYVFNIRELRAELNHMQNLLSQDYSMQLLKLDEAAAPPEKPIKPRKMLIVAVSTIVGGGLAILAALISSAAKRRKIAFEQ